ncbi:MAG: DMT family transporter [Chloroflexi bacterium]|nr:DMT family transporter [Chloroflexota bacterium]
MIEYVTIVLIGLLGGIAVGIQSPIAGAMAQRIGGTASSFIVHVSGAILSGALLFLRGGERIREWHTLPWYMLLAGVWGLILYLTINVTMPRLGATMVVVLITVGQLFVGMVIDHWGWFGVPLTPISLTRVLGGLVLLIGVFLIAR